MKSALHGRAVSALRRGGACPDRVEVRWTRDSCGRCSKNSASPPQAEMNSATTPLIETARSGFGILDSWSWVRLLGAHALEVLRPFVFTRAS